MKTNILNHIANWVYIYFDQLTETAMIVSIAKMHI